MPERLVKLAGFIAHVHCDRCGQYLAIPQDWEVTGRSPEGKPMVRTWSDKGDAAVILEWAKVHDGPFHSDHEEVWTPV